MPPQLRFHQRQVRFDFVKIISKIFPLDLINPHGDENDDGCVPRTPTLVASHRAQHEGKFSHRN